MSAAVLAAEPLWLTARRAVAMDRFAARGLPTAKDEAWRFTNLHALTARAPSGTARLTLSAAPEGVTFTRLSTLLAQAPERLEALLALPEGADALSALNLAMFSDGYVLEVAPGLHLDAPLEVSHDNQGRAVHMRALVLLGEGASATLVERANGSGWSNNVTHAVLGAGARLRHAKLQAQAADSVHLSAMTLTLGAGADHESVILALGAGVSREAVTTALTGEGATASLRGAYLLGGKQQASFVPELLHLARNCTSRQLVKGVLGGTAHGVFLGHIGVPEGGDGTNAGQTNRNILLSPGARVDTRPRLEILADDVKCSHSATVGALDETALFYLQSRGLAPPQARRMLIEAFAADIVDGADLPAPQRESLQQALSFWAETLA
ncbi:Fe-S cluster assembly protein SufD [Acidocella sp.]|uniref:Fe-S cluster assembly protein SufD n=1 Tax=Acidocella sp. TaxID=50710 RepID=UPI00179B3325|nr:Fe-S cluster assembly protein SufD [Acidocella sp.]NNM57815.1 Fe-S cluster assembly protein SufD [Acidocella sp.]